MENTKGTKVQGGHIININNRETMTITGVTDVITFNEDLVLLDTIMGAIHIKGKNMKVNKLNVDTGDMCIEGEVQSLAYTTKESKNKESIIKKLFK